MIEKLQIKESEIIDTIFLAENTRFSIEVKRYDDYRHHFEKAVIEEILILKREVERLKEELNAKQTRSCT